MARDERGIIQQIFADTGDVADPSFDFEEGWPVAYAQAGGETPEREVFNKLFQVLYALGFDLTRFGGAMPWDAIIDYEVPAVVTGADGNIYVAVEPSGPGVAAGAINPVIDEDDEFWKRAGRETQATGSIYVGCGAMVPSVTGGATQEVIETANGLSRAVGVFPGTDNDTSLDFEYPMPSDWDGGTLTAQLFWNAPAAAVAGDEIRFTLAAVAGGDGVASSMALGAAVAITDAAIAADADHESAASGAMTVGGAPAAGSMVRFKLSRDFDYGAQPLADVVYGLGLRIHYTKA